MGEITDEVVQGRHGLDAFGEDLGQWLAILGEAGDEVRAEGTGVPGDTVNAARFRSRRGAGTVEQDDGVRGGGDEVFVGSAGGRFGGEGDAHQVRCPRAGRADWPVPL